MRKNERIRGEFWPLVDRVVWSSYLGHVFIGFAARQKYVQNVDNLLEFDRENMKE